MLLPSFEYLVPSTVDEAVGMWRERPGGAYLLGGTDLLPQMRAGKKTTSRMIDIKRIPRLHELRERSDGSLWIGAAVPMAEVETHPGVLTRFSPLSECCKTVGAWPLRNRATLAGNICNASPAADTAVALLALDARVVVVHPDGERMIPVKEFFLGPGKSALSPGELVTDIVLPAAPTPWKGAYLRLSRRKGMDLATVGVLVAKTNENGHSRHRVALAAVAPTPLRVYEAEELLDREGIPRAAEKASKIAEAACSPITDLRGTSEYRREMVGVLTRRGLMSLS